MQWFIWIILYVIHVLSIMPYDPIGQALVYSAINIGSYFIIANGNSFIFLPKLYEKQKYLLYAVFSLLLVVGIAYIKAYTTVYVYNHNYTDKPILFKWSTVASSFMTCILIYLSSILFFITLHFFKLKQKQEQLLKQKAEAELNLLKAQVQPHFLFNTLNNIYFVAQRESPSTANLLEKLSQIMRYFVDQAPRDSIPLTVELNFIRNYIELEKVRMRYPLRVTINVIGINDGIVVPPMLMIPLVENVFKHGIDKLRNDNFISLELTAGKNSLSLVVENRLVEQTGEKSSIGTGIKNLKNRLDLVFGTNYVLHSSESAYHYRTQLTIPL